LKNQQELFIKKVHNGIFLLSKDAQNPWQIMFDACDEFSDNFMNNRIQPTQTRGVALSGLMLDINRCNP
jgi:hypothetical protein